MSEELPTHPPTNPAPENSTGPAAMTPQERIAKFLKDHPQTKVVNNPGTVTAIQGYRK